jgi:hypothetical protein
MSLGDSPHEDLAAAFGARRDLGHEYDKEIAAGVVERMSREIDARVDQRVAEIVAAPRLRPPRRGGTGLAVYSMLLGIPLSAIAGGEAHFGGLLVCWGGIVAINLANALRRGTPVVKTRR